MTLLCIYLIPTLVTYNQAEHKQWKQQRSFNGHFTGQPGQAMYQNVSILDLIEPRMKKMVATTLLEL